MLTGIPALTLHVGHQQVAISLVVDPVLEGTTLPPRLRVPPHQIDLFAVLHRILDEVADQLLLQRGVRDVVGRTVNQVDGNDPGGSSKVQLILHYIVMQLTAHRTRHSLWDVSEGFHGLGLGGVRLDVLPRCVLHLTLLHNNKSVIVIVCIRRSLHRMIINLLIIDKKLCILYFILYQNEQKCFLFYANSC